MRTVTPEQIEAFAREIAENSMKPSRWTQEALEYARRATQDRANKAGRTFHQQLEFEIQEAVDRHYRQNVVNVIKAIETRDAQTVMALKSAERSAVSRKVFTYMTGIKLPKTQRDSQPILEQWLRGEPYDDKAEAHSGR